MNESTLDEIVGSLDDGVRVTSDRRGFGKKRGVPDSVFWLSPPHDDIPSRLLPILVELEGTFAGASDDFAKFAARDDDDQYQYHLEWPMLDAVGQSPIRRDVKYDIVGIRASQLARQWSVSEGEMHDAFQKWCDRFQSEFSVSTTDRQYGDTVVLKWSLDITLFGHDVSTCVPLIVDPGSNVSSVVETRLNSPTIPSVVVVNNKYDDRDTATYHHSTQIRFPSIIPSKH